MEFNKLTEIPNLHQIKLVEQQLKGVVIESPLQYASKLSSRFGANIYLKREDLQKVRSYKIRGAYHKISNIPVAYREKGVVAASAGNHAQGVAYACASLRIHATIFMPHTTPAQKLDAVRLFGGNYVRVQLIGNSYDEAFLASKVFCEKSGAIFIPPFDDFDIIAGQSTVALEIFKQVKQPIDFLFVPFGGGGLTAGTCLVKDALSPQTKVIAAEPFEAPSTTRSMEEGEVVTLEKIDPFVDGAAVKKIGELTFGICKNALYAVQTIKKSKLCQTMLVLYHHESILTEPAGALSVAALDYYAEAIRNKTVVCVISGGNFDPKRLPEIEICANAEK